MYEVDIPKKGHLCSGSCSDYSYTAEINGGVVTVVMDFDGKKHKFTTTNKYRVAEEAQKYYRENAMERL